MLPEPKSIAAIDAERLALVLREVGGLGASIGEGWMACDEEGSWATYAAGLGVRRPVSHQELDELIAFYRSHDRCAEVQTTPYQHRSLFEGLARRGFVVFEQETVLARSLSGLPKATGVEGLHTLTVDRENPAARRAWVSAHIEGFYGTQTAPAAMIAIAERVAMAERCHLWRLQLEGDVVGSGGLEIYGDCAVLIAASVLPRFRRRGIQQDFIRHRLMTAKDLGCRYALIGSKPAGPTERNALRAGFRVAYTQTGLRRAKSVR